MSDNKESSFIFKAADFTASQPPLSNNFRYKVADFIASRHNSNSSSFLNPHTAELTASQPLSASNVMNNEATAYTGINGENK